MFNFSTKLLIKANFAPFRLQTAFNLSSKYAKRVYQIASQWKDNPTVSLRWSSVTGLSQYDLFQRLALPAALAGRLNALGTGHVALPCPGGH